MPIRNGRFKSPRAIITGRTGTFFRILNSAEFDNADKDTNAFTVTFGSGMHDFVVVRPTFSVDVFVQSDVEIESVIAMKPVEGIYEALPNPDFKSGRFKTKVPLDPTAGIPIITTGAGNGTAVYRIFNSGTVTLQMFTQDPNGTNPTDFKDPIAPEESYDFVTPPNKIVLVKGTGADTDHIEGIYDFIAKV